MASRKIEDLVPELQPLALQFIAECAKVGLKVIITCTARTIQEQKALYAQGRLSLTETIQLRKDVHLPPISDIENKRKVTWTMDSRHIVNWQDDDPNNNQARAFDFALETQDGKVYYDLKADVTGDNFPDYLQAGEVGEHLGLEWGGRWHTPDYPHMQLKGK